MFFAVSIRMNAILLEICFSTNGAIPFHFPTMNRSQVFLYVPNARRRADVRRFTQCHSGNVV